MARDTQEEITSQMRCPPSNDNAVMQLNMGEGKSSVITPMVAASLANGKLVRVIAAKPQSKRMYQIPLSRLGGLLGRPVYLMPFSRALKLQPSQATAIHKMCKERRYPACSG